MREVKMEISKDEYLRYESNPAAYNRERRETIPINMACGTGWYGCTCYKSITGQYFRIDTVGDSCD